MKILVKVLQESDLLPKGKKVGDEFGMEYEPSKDHPGIVELVNAGVIQSLNEPA